ncbi:MAG: hypothetical protein CM15mP25_5920 [Gammaproteobacteria bacterium]|nr:MAG: hypothetical protein CM15mP25_5920 [Gammaproteobacteria bacterium]
MVFTRFDYSTAMPPARNMVSRATFIACEWINEQRPEMLHYMLSGNFDTEKKTSSVNLLKPVANASPQKSLCPARS